MVEERQKMELSGLSAPALEERRDEVQSTPASSGSGENENSLRVREL